MLAPFRAKASYQMLISLLLEPFSNHLIKILSCQDNNAGTFPQLLNRNMIESPTTVGYSRVQVGHKMISVSARELYKGDAMNST